ncbi:MAG TPA: DUF1707 domain-containing protein [Pseudonocardiaceae bacterium]|nr:DUF1707 domain-containing protein [Pseudonocardiaceae bacterium]
MSEFRDADLRVADSERENALTALSEHVSQGRLNIDEYGERSAQISTAKTRGELRALFSDLPPPHPQFGATGFAPAPVVPQPGRQVAGRPPGGATRAVVAGLVPVAGLIAVGLFLFAHLPWVVFLLPAALIMFGSSVWGKGWRDDHRRGRRYD